MTLKEIIEIHNEDEVLEALEEMYPETKNQKEAYREVLEYVRHTQTTQFDDFVIHIGLIDPSSNSETFEDGVDEEAYLSISGYSEKENLNFALGFCKWEEWANAEIIIEADLMISGDELAALCIYEMTFYGFDQETIFKELQDLENGITNELYH
ncbi:DUF6557 family protein [Fusibacter tunisiensis]|jgi:hypothetical protein|uniref:Uncharacterized protein n=1 Tax=Fusibacter tunisiensis TaxID=1008308 RepID=A0ABS2MT24_9FIRM|nr:DUF6557 family protein [Fusibacter tunisiensis]MBM7562586.1 hypothetical protein [Fusibacter tunisiensis]